MRALTAVLYQIARLILGAASRIYFHSIEVRGRERVPRRGPLLVVANHPASFTDVVVLAGALPRRLHFLAMAPIFRPWIRGLALRLCGTLPVYRQKDDPSQMHRNQDTFRAVHAILDRGGAVLIFPEGTSETDRDIVKVKTGAARIALGHTGPQELVLLPVGLHFVERSSFWSGIVVSVGRPIELAPFRSIAQEDPQEAVRQLTDRIELTLEKLILHLDELERRALVEGIEQLYAEEAQSVSPGSHPLGIVRGMAECVEYYARTDPVRLERGWKRIQSYQRRLEALGIDDRSFREMLPPRGRVPERLRLFGLGLLGIVPALIGGLFHYVPYRLTGRLGSLLTSDPTQLAAFRIALGVILFPATYAALALGFQRLLGWSPRAVVFSLVVLAALGLHALAYFHWLSHQGLRLRLIVLRARHRRRIARLRRQRRELIRLFEQAWNEWRARREAEIA